MTNIQNAWERLAANLPKTLEKTALRNLRNAFFAGAGFVVAKVIEMGEPTTAEDDAVKMLGDLEKEMTVFTDGLRKQIMEMN